MTPQQPASDEQDWLELPLRKLMTDTQSVTARHEQVGWDESEVSVDMRRIEEEAKAAIKQKLQETEQEWYLKGYGDGRTTMEAEQVQKLAEVERATVLTRADVAWCLGKLRGLGYPVEHLERKYQLGQLQSENGGGSDE